MSDDLDAKVAWLNDRSGKPFEAVRDYGRQHLGWDKETPMTDHKAEAEEILEHRSSVNDPHGEALVHATLYLAEQQRIANQIAFMAQYNSTNHHSFVTYHEGVFTQIVRGVGIDL